MIDRSSTSSLMGALLGQVVVGAPADLRALSEEEMDARVKAQTWMMRHHAPSLYDILALANWRPPVIVPEGWAEWYAHGDAAA